MTRRKDVVSWCWLLLVAWWCLSCFCTAQQVGTAAVHWTLYSGLNMSWNEASSFCKFLGGHLPVLNTRIKWNGFHAATLKWKNDHQLTNEVWSGLFTQAPFTYPKLWEANCSVQPDGLGFWGAGEPDHNATDLCVRYKPSPHRLYTWKCKDPLNIICEFDKGSCGQRLNSIPVALLTNLTLSTVSLNSSTMEQSCWQQCMNYPPMSDGRECVAATFSSGVCIAYMGGTLVSTTNTTQYPETTMLKDCFDDDINSSYGYPTFSDRSDTPRPAGDPCSADTTTSTTDSTANGFSSSTAGPLPPLCPCMKTHTTTVKLAAMHRNTTSRYRRSRKCEWGSHSVYASTSSATFVIVVGVAGFLFVVCDINRFTGPRDKRRRGSVEPQSA